MVPALPEGEAQEAEPAQTARQPAARLGLEAMPPGESVTRYTQPKRHPPGEGASASRCGAGACRRHPEPAVEPGHQAAEHPAPGATRLGERFDEAAYVD